MILREEYSSIMRGDPVPQNRAGMAVPFQRRIGASKLLHCTGIEVHEQCRFHWGGAAVQARARSTSVGMPRHKQEVVPAFWECNQSALEVFITYGFLGDLLGCASSCRF